MTKNYTEAAEMADILSANGGDAEQLMALGYQAGLRDASVALKASGAQVPSSEGSRRMYAVLADKLASYAREFEPRATDLGI